MAWESVTLSSITNPQNHAIRVEKWNSNKNVWEYETTIKYTVQFMPSNATVPITSTFRLSMLMPYFTEGYRFIKYDRSLESGNWTIDNNGITSQSTTLTTDLYVGAIRYNTQVPTAVTLQFDNTVEMNGVLLEQNINLSSVPINGNTTAFGIYYSNPDTLRIGSAWYQAGDKPAFNLVNYVGTNDSLHMAPVLMYDTIPDKVGAQHVIKTLIYYNLINAYSIAQSSTGNGSITTPAYGISGDTITVTFTPDDGYKVDWSNVSITSSVAVALVQTSDTTATFTMPSAEVTINGAFVRSLKAGVTVSGGHGTAAVSNEHPAEGDTVTITCYPDSGYEVDTVTSFDAAISQVATNQYQFTMPNVDVLATVTFKETPFFNITVEAASNGSVSANPTSGYSGTTIQLTVAPDTGYSLRSLYVLAGTDSVPTTKVDDTHYTFTLPSFNIVVRARFTDGDPYSPGGNSDPSTPGGTGSFDDETIPITPPAIPSVSVQDTGLYTIFSLSQAELNGFTNYLWSDLFSLPTVTKYLNNATEHILSLHILPFTVATDSSREIKFMGIGTNTNGSVVTRQHQQIDCGSVLLEEYYGSALDYNPWTKIKLYVPYCGEIELDPDEVMGKVVSLKYTVDILTGDCYANVAVSGTTMYQLSGNCAMRLPVSASNWSAVLRATASGLAIAAGVGAAAMGAVGAGLTAAGAEAFRVSNEAMGTRAGDIAFGEAVALGRAGQAVTERTPQVGSTNSYMATMAQKSSFIHTGVQTGGASFMSVQVPYILIKRPRQALPENYNHYVGYPAHYTRTLGNMTGFTQIVDWNPASIPCTESERTEIDRLLKEGVIL